VNFLDSASEVLPVALLYVGKPGFSRTAADYPAAGEMLKKVRPYVTRFSSSGYIEEMVKGSLCAVMGYSGDINIARARALEAKNGQVIEALVPPSGATLFFDSMAIPADAKHPKNAHLFINYILRPEVHASLTNKVFYANPNKASLKFVEKSVAESKSIFLSAKDLAGMSAPDSLPQDIRRVQTRAFTNFKAAK
jgi:putrescine transport system substrate-binding protein